MRVRGTLKALFYVYGYLFTSICFAYEHVFEVTCLVNFIYARYCVTCLVSAV
jgi:hypothetical protein